MTPTLILICNLLAVCSSAFSVKADKQGCWLWYAGPASDSMHMMISWPNLPKQAKSCVDQRRKSP